MGRRDVTLGNRNEAGQAGLGRKQVVAARVEGAVPDPKADREQLSRGFEDELEVRLPESPLGLIGDRLEPS